MENTEIRMGRPREFDEDVALEAAMRVFWEKSYEGATMSDLTAAMGINRSSMYAAFGGKEALFRRVMERYREGPMGFMRLALAKSKLREAIPALLHGTVQFLSQPGHPRGCLSLQSGLACGSGAQSVRESLIAWRREGEEAIRARLQQARKAGELPPAENPADLARYLMAVMNGLGVMASNGAGRQEMKKIAETALRALPI